MLNVGLLLHPQKKAGTKNVYGHPSWHINHRRKASCEINLYVVLATNPLLVREANRSHFPYDNPVYR